MVTYLDVLGGAKVYKNKEYIGTIDLEGRVDYIPYRLYELGIEGLTIELEKDDKLEIFGALGMVFGEMNNSLPLVQNIQVRIDNIHKTDMTADMVVEKSLTMISNNGYSEKMEELIQEYLKKE